MIHEPPHVDRGGVAVPAQGEQQAIAPVQPRLENHPRRAPQFLDAHAGVPDAVLQELELLPKLPAAVGRHPGKVCLDGIVHKEEIAVVVHGITPQSVAEPVPDRNNPCYSASGGASSTGYPEMRCAASGNACGPALDHE